MSQKSFVISALEKRGGFATLSELYRLVDVSTWKTKTPQESIRRILQTNKEFYKIEAGLWGLISQKKDIEQTLKPHEELFTHSYYQGIIAQIGNLRCHETFIPHQDQNRNFLEKKLSEIASIKKIFDFSYSNIVQKAKMVDVVWFNERKLPHSFFEVEHTSDFKNSLNKFYELQDFRANFFIVASKNRQKQFENIINNSIYTNIKPYVKFAQYETIIKQYELEKAKYNYGI